jgi:hypothetical protein
MEAVFVDRMTARSGRKFTAKVFEDRWIYTPIFAAVPAEFRSKASARPIRSEIGGWL